jgi:hypothetical protein
MLRTQVKARFLLVGERFQQGVVVAVAETKPAQARLAPEGLWTWQATVVRLLEPAVSQWGSDAFRHLGTGVGGTRQTFVADADEMVSLVEE